MAFRVSGMVRSSVPAVARVAQRLRRAYGRPTRPRARDPLGQLIATILSQNTSDVNSGRAFAVLRERLPTWDAVAKAPLRQIARAIRSGGLANVKAPRIRSLLRHVYRTVGAYRLDFIKKMAPGEAKGYLASFDGVGPKTAACVLLFACGMPVLPVDTHVHRVSRRLGLIPDRMGAAKAHEFLEGRLAQSDVFDFHVLMIEHGRRTCRARRPDCRRCSLAPLCPSADALVRGGEAAPA